MLLDGGLQFKEKRVSNQTRKRKVAEEQREGRTHRPGVGRKGITYYIRITGHNILPSKAIRTISIDRPREIWRINGLTGAGSSSYNFPPLEVMTNKVKEKKRKEDEHILEQ